MKKIQRSSNKWGLRLALLALTACSNNQQPAAPAGDHAALEQLAQAYRQVGESYPVQPRAMPPKGRKEFLDRVFRQAGYDYSATLLALAQAKSGAETSNQDQRDLVELLLIPGKGIQDSALGNIYTSEELAAVKQLRANFR